MSLVFRFLSEQFIKKMSTERKTKETLARKLSRKKVTTMLCTKIGQAEDKSQLFKQIKNKEKSNINSKKKEKEVPRTVENGTTFALKSEISRNDNINMPSIEVTVKRSSRKIKINSGGNMASFPAKNSKNISLNVNLNKEDEEASTSKKIKQELEVKWQPPNWKTVLENMRHMRSNNKAPVDTMGCHKCADESADEKTQRFHKLIALMLSSQTKDETTYHAMLRLREHRLTPEVICNMKLNVLENILHPVSFYKNKAKYMQQTCKILVEKYNSDIPNNIKDLVALPGVGPKMAHICMATAWNEVTGIGVDVHVHRISNRIGWLPKPTKEPEQTRLALEAWLPQHLWSEVNHLLVGFGQTICTPVKPKCIECLNLKICPSAANFINKKVIDIKIGNR